MSSIEAHTPAEGLPDPVSARQHEAALAYAGVLLSEAEAPAAAEDALAAFSQALAAGAPGGADDETLLALTRLMVAVSLPDRSVPADRRQAVWASIGATSHCTCREAAALLATRANHNIQPRESAALDAHLAECEDCRALAERTVAAEAAFRRALVPPRRTGGGLGAIPGALGAITGAVGAIPRSAGAALLALVLVGAGVLSLAGGGSHATTRASTRPRTQPVATLTQTALVSSPTAPAKSHARRHAATRRRPHHARPHRHTAPAPVVTTNATPISTYTASTYTAETPTAPADTVAATPPSTATPAPATAPAPTHTTTQATAVSGQSTLPAETATQQGIGSLTGGGGG